MTLVSGITEALKNYDSTKQRSPHLTRQFKFGQNYKAWLSNRGLDVQKVKLYEDAIASFDKTLQLKPDYHEAWVDRGVVLGILLRHEEAFTSFDRAVQFQPDDPLLG